MQKPTQTKQSEQLNIQENAENNHKENSTLIERHPIEGTPFTIIKDNENWFMVMGDYRVTETTKTKEEQIDKLDTEKWLLIMHICIIAIKKMKQSEQQEEENFRAYMKTPGNNLYDKTKNYLEPHPYETESL